MVLDVKKRIMLLAALVVLACMMCGCGILIVEDSAPVYIGMDADRTLTEVC